MGSPQSTCKYPANQNSFFKEQIQADSQERKIVAKNMLQKYEELCICPISLQIMKDPVSLPCGHTFERGNIEIVLKQQKQCPLDRQRFVLQNLMPNYFAKQSIQMFQKQLTERNKKLEDFKNSQKEKIQRHKEKFLKVYQNRICQKCSDPLNEELECKKCSAFFKGECILCQVFQEGLDKETMICKECKEIQQKFYQNHLKNECPDCKCQLDSVEHFSKCVNPEAEVCPFCKTNMNAVDHQKVCAEKLSQELNQIPSTIERNNSNSQFVSRQRIFDLEHCSVCLDKFLQLNQGLCASCFLQKAKRAQSFRQ